MKKFNLIENRLEGLEKYAVWQLRRSDVDTAISVMNYIFKRNEFNTEQKLWFCWLYANTYQCASALAIWNEFPDFNLVDFERINRFNSEKGRMIPYEKDVKYSKMFLDKMFNSYYSVISPYGSQRAFFKHVCNSQDPYENYVNLDSIVIKSFYKFGRYISWFYLQSLKDCCQINISAPSMKFGPDSSSPTNGMLLALGMDKFCSRIYINGTIREKRIVSWNKDLMMRLEYEATQFIEHINNKYKDVFLDREKLETILCSYQKLYRFKDGRYLGYYVDRMMKNVVDCEKNWKGVDYQIIRDWLIETYPDYSKYSSLDGRIDQSRMREFLETGTLSELNMYEDLKNE